MSITLTKIKAREILDSRGFPTVEAEIVASNGMRAYASVPSGASTGKNEALELRDKDPDRYLGRGVRTACQHVLEDIAHALKGRVLPGTMASQQEYDELLIKLDGTPNKQYLGANATLAVSLALAKLNAELSAQPLYRWLAQNIPVRLPVAMMNIINGGAHADNNLDIQEFMIIPAGFNSFSESIQAGVEIFHHLKTLLRSKNYATSVGDEGGFAPELRSHREALDLILQAIHQAGYRSGRDVYLGLDIASSEFYNGGKYHLAHEQLSLTSAQFCDYLANLVAEYPIISIEDGMSEGDWEGWQLLTQRMGRHVQLVGDDLFVTNTVLLNRGIEDKVANAILIKPNQIGTLTETFAAIAMAKLQNYATIISHRSGETEDSFIADLAVGTSAGQIKTGSLCRTDRVAKYNQLLRIEADLKENAQFSGARAFACLQEKQ